MENQIAKQTASHSSISRFECKATAGIGYAYKMKVEYRNVIQGDEIQYESSWKRTDSLGSVSLGLTKYINIPDVTEIKEGALVRLDIDIKAGPDHVRANEEFIYTLYSNKQACYDGRGSLFNPSVEFNGLNEYRDSDLKDAAVGFGRPIEKLPILDHTFVRIGDVYFQCHGGVDGAVDENALCKGAGNIRLSEEIAHGNTATKDGIKVNDGECYIKYGKTGVCHQMANRILRPSAIMVSDARGYFLSSLIYGDYGSTVKSESFVNMNEDLSESYFSKVNILLGKFLADEIGYDEWIRKGICLSINNRLGDGYAEKHISIVDCVFAVRKRKDELCLNLSDNEYFDSVNKMCIEMQHDIANLLTTEEYIKLIDFAPNTDVRIVE